MHDFKAEMTDRTRNFALPVFRLCKSLHGCYEMEHVGRQLLRSATSVAANFRAACYAKSTQDFYAKIKTCEEKTDVACFWLEFIADGELLPADCVSEIRCEAVSIAGIIAAACKTVHAKKEER